MSIDDDEELNETWLRSCSVEEEQEVGDSGSHDAGKDINGEDNVRHDHDEDQDGDADEDEEDDTDTDDTEADGGLKRKRTEVEMSSSAPSSKK